MWSFEAEVSVNQVETSRALPDGGANAPEALRAAGLQGARRIFNRSGLRVTFTGRMPVLQRKHGE